MANLPRIVTLFSRGTNVFMVFCGPHLPPAFHFVCGLGGGGAANKMEGKRKVSLCSVTPPQVAVVLNEIPIVLNVRLTVLNYGSRW